MTEKEKIDRIINEHFDPQGTLRLRGWTVTDMSQIFKKWPPSEDFFERSRKWKEKKGK